MSTRSYGSTSYLQQSNINVVVPSDFGTSNNPFTTARADLGDLVTNLAYPYRASGKLFFIKDNATYLCSAALIEPGIAVTAAHCVTGYGKRTFYGSFTFIPGYRAGEAPFGKWGASQVYVPSDYFNGTGCANGVVCKNDVAVIVLAPGANPTYPGTDTGWYGYAWDGYGFAGKKTQITQIGYPGCLDDGELMERNDAYGVKTASKKNNTLIGSLMCEGASGGPWVINFGLPPTLTNTTPGIRSTPNLVVGVTSWGYEKSTPKQMGASPFTSSNILDLMNKACSGTNADRCN